MSLYNKKIKSLTLILIATLGLISYINSFGNRFIWDDEDLIIKNLYVRDWKYLHKFFIENSIQGAKKGSNFYRPIWNISFAIDYHIWKLNPTGYHLTNTFLHIANSLLVTHLISSLSVPVIGVLTGSLFAVHPIHTEVTTYISGRADSLVALFMLTALFLFIKSLGAAKHVKLFYSFSIISFVLSILSKESALILPLVLILYIFCYAERSRRLSKLKYTVPFFIIAINYIALRFTLLNFSKTVAENLPQPFFYIPFYIRLMTFLKVLSIYFGLLLFPIHLQMERSLGLVTSILNFNVRITLIILILSILFVKGYYRKYRIVPFATMWFYLTLLPNSNLFPINALIYEHWLYLPSIGFFSIISWAIWRLLSTPKRIIRIAIFVLCCIVVISYLGRTILRNRDWLEPITFYEKTLIHDPDSARLHNNLAMAYADKQMIDLAIKEYIKAIELNDAYPQTHYNLANAYLQKGWIKQAEDEYKKSLNLDPNFIYSYIALGNLYYLQERFKESESSFKEALKLEPSNKTALDFLDRINEIKNR